MRVRPGVEMRSALVVAGGAASDRGAALSAECDAITRDHILNRVRLLERHVQSAELFVQSVAIGRGVGLGKRSVVWDEAFLEPHHERGSPLSPLAVCIELRRTASSSP